MALRLRNPRFGARSPLIQIPSNLLLTLQFSRDLQTTNRKPSMAFGKWKSYV